MKFGKVLYLEKNTGYPNVGPKNVENFTTPKKLQSIQK